MTNIIYNEEEFSLEFQEYHTNLFISFWINEQYIKVYKRITGVDVGFIIHITNGGDLVGYMQADSSEVIYSSLKNRLNKRWVDNEIRIFEKSLNGLKKEVEKNRRSKKISNVKSSLAKIYRLFVELCPYSNSAYLLSHEIEKIILQKLIKRFSESEANEILTSLSTPIRETFLVRYSRDIKNAALKLKKFNIKDVNRLKDLYGSNSDVKRLFKDLEKKYFCMTSLNAEERTAESFIPDVYDILVRPKKENMIRIPKEIEKEAYLLRALIYFKDELSTFVIPYVRFGLDKQWKQLANSLGISFNDLEQLFAEEILFTTPKDVKKLVKERREATLMVHQAHKGTIKTEGKTALKQIEEINKQIVVADKNISEIQGKVGSHGKTKGIVQKILNTNDISKFKEGNVLVAVYTAPDLVPAMKKACAIITDTGGITSHAAIVSRELGKPCVVGLKIATQVLKDGDLIEVDAERGVVRKL